MSGTIAVYTALYGAYDELPEPVEQDVDVDFICFTDSADLRSPRWRVVLDPPRYEHPRMAAKVHKMLPHEVLDGGRRWALWIDANVLIDNPAFAREAIAAAASTGAGVTTFRHPQRDCIYEEAIACSELPKCEGVPVLEQVAAYRAEGYPPHAGLYGCRSIAWDTTSSAARQLGRRWLDECERWTFRDQLSLPVVARRMGLEPGVFPHHKFRHAPKEAAACFLSRRDWGRRLIERGRTTAAYQRASDHNIHPVPRRWWAIGNPWFDVVPHRRDT